MSKLVLTLLGAIVLSGSPMLAITIDLLDVNNRQLWNTGFNSSFSPGTAPGGQQDSNYTWTVGSVSSPAVVTSSLPIPPWNPNSLGTNTPNDYKWISPQANNLGPGQTTAQVSTTFTLSGAPKWILELDGRLWADNEILNNTVYLIGPNSEVYTATVPAPARTSQGYGLAFQPNYQGFFSFGTLTGLNPGTYTIRFDVFNDADAPNPTGLQVAWSKGLATGVPEPGAYLLMGTIGGALFLLNRRRRRSQAV
ncbi:MAG: PEP-CTERM sorting domain-containing protein [Bryobacteraceae bacterium]|nr:PEP-CTERM sorting domain-containing protein [Bryobacteraceae bacterium]